MTDHERALEEVGMQAMHTTLTWTCEICGDERNDEHITVTKHQLPGPVAAVRNVRHCADRRTCATAAANWPDSDEGRRLIAALESP